MSDATDAAADNLQDIIHMAAVLHSHQLDLAGVPYIAHPLAVMRRVSPRARRVALAHDWKEDCGAIDAVLHHLHFTAAEIEAVDLLTRRRWMEYDLYIDTIINSGKHSHEAKEIAIEVKIADLADNLDEGRWQIAQETGRDEKRREKYVRAYTLLVRHQANATFDRAEAENRQAQTIDAQHELQEAKLIADRLSARITKWIGAYGAELICPRAKCTPSPCAAIDGAMAVTLSAGAHPYGICVGCGESVVQIVRDETLI